MSSHHTYRPDIDGLRAIAVLAVILFHADAAWLPSGFLGVDVFFVISGFLITGIIAREWQNGTFTLRNFYLRRAKRILPAFLVVLIATLIACAYLMLPYDLGMVLKTARYSLHFAANIYFGRETGYFDVEAAEQPLQHIWSLSVEEQFYFVFPLLMLFLWRRWQGFPLKKIHILFGLLIIASVASFYYEYRKYDAYYLPWTRAFELLIGAWFALITGATKPVSQRIRAPYLPTLALLAILITLALPPEFWPDSKSLPRLIICFATAYLLASGSLNAGKVQRFLSMRVWVAIGLWSYSLYLWHWPIFSLMRYVHMNNPVPTAWLLVGIVATFVLSYLSYRFVEQPFRKMQPTRRQIALAAVAYISLFAVVVLVQKNIFRELNQQRQQLASHIDQLPPRFHGQQADMPPSVLLLGDSHADQYRPFFDLVSQNEGWRATIESANACSVLHNRPLNRADRNYSRECQQLRAALPQLVSQHQHIMFAQRWSFHVNDLPKPQDISSNTPTEADFLTHFENTLQWLLAQGKTVYVFSDNPNIGIYHYRHLHFVERGFGFTPPPLPELNSRITDEANQIIKNVVAKYPQVHWVEIDFARYLPADYRFNGLPIYADDDHLNHGGTAYLAKRFIEDGQRLIVPKSTTDPSTK